MVLGYVERLNLMSFVQSSRPHREERSERRRPLTKMNLECRGCGGRNVKLFLDLGDQPHCNRLIPSSLADRKEPYYPLRVGYCTDTRRSSPFSLNK